MTYGPLVELPVDGQPMGGRIAMASAAAPWTSSGRPPASPCPMSRAELVVNGEIRESLAMAPGGERALAVKIDRSSWVALLVRGHYADKPEIIAAHTTPV